VAVSEEGLVKKRTRHPKPVDTEGAVRKRRGSDNEVGTNIITELWMLVKRE
jgi:transcription factor MYB, plant